MSDEILSGEGGDPPNKPESRGAKRRRKLSGLESLAMGELAFLLYEVAALDMPSDRKWPMLRAKLLAWRGRFIR